MPTQDHKTARLKFARNHMTWYEEWKNVVFFNTKSNLHEPDAFKYYSHNLRTNKAVAMSRNFDGRCLIVWTAFNYSKMCQYVKFVSKRRKIYWLIRKFNV